MASKSSDDSSTLKYALLGCGGLTVLLAGAIVGVLFFAWGLVKDSTPYKKALAAAREHPEVQEELGQPIEAGASVEGDMNVRNGTGAARLGFPISGPNGSASVQAHAVMRSSEWTIEELIVRVDNRAEPIRVIDQGTQAETARVEEDPSTYTEIFAGAAHACARTDEDQLECWGNESDGKLLAPPVAFEEVSAGMDHTCGIGVAGQLECWGDNQFGQTVAPGGTYTKVSAGFTHTCAVTTEGELECWGAGGESGPDMFDEGQTDAPEGTFSDVAAGSFHSCAIDSDDQLTCWGDDENGESDPPEGTYTSLALGGDHGCAITSSGQVRCWGADNHGQLAAPDGTFVQVTAGKNHTCARTESGTIQCWGDDRDGQASVPDGEFLFVSAQASVTCAVDTDGASTCWGDDQAGELEEAGRREELYRGPTEADRPEPQGKRRPRSARRSSPPTMYGADDVQDVSARRAGAIIREHAGKPRLVVLWRSTCGPCRKMFPEVREFARTCHAAGIVPLVFSTDARHKNVERYVAGAPVPFRPYRIEKWQRGGLDSSLTPAGVEIGDTFGTPLVAVIDAEGRRIGQHEGSSGIQRARGWVQQLR